MKQKDGKEVIFLHPDLGIGGAERLVVDAALALEAKNYNVHIVTAHHDKNHCFQETKNGDLKVTSVGDWLPRSFLGKFTAFWATIRMIWAALYVAFNFNPDVIICDQVSNAIPLLRYFSKSKIIFYCHFPDQLLTQRKTFLKKLYRGVMDYIEEKTTGMANLILVNSEFTGGVFSDTFSSLRDRSPSVLYPSLNTSTFDQIVSSQKKSNGNEFTFLSINRYERKKNIGLAINALNILQKMKKYADIRLIIAGGYDHRVKENVEHYQELVDLAESLGISSKVEFLKSPSDTKKVELLRNADCLIYTPSKEHFGIVPIEAMYNETPVIAVNDGGPLETVVEGETGFLRPPKPEDFAEAMQEIIDIGDDVKRTMGANGKKRVLQCFSFNAFSNNLDVFVKKVLEI